MIEEWEWKEAKSKLSIATQKLHALVKKIDADSIYPTRLHRARLEYDDAQTTVSNMQRQMSLDRREKKRLKKQLKGRL
jgi:hypothetical protein